MSDKANAGHVKVQRGNMPGGQEPLHYITEKLEQFIEENESNREELLRSTTEVTAEVKQLSESLAHQAEELLRLKNWCDEQDRVKPVGHKLYTPMDGAKPLKDPRRHDFAMFCLDGITFRLSGEAKFQSEAWKRAQTINTVAEGGYLVHPEQQEMITQLVERYGAARRLLRIIPMNKNEMRVPTLVGRPQVYWPDEGQAPGSESAVTFGRPAITAKRMMAVDTLSIEVEQDSAPMLSDFIPDVFAVAVSKEEDKQAFTADAPADPFDGLLNIAGVQELTLGSGQTTYASITYDDIIDVINKVSAHALGNCSFLMSTSLVLALRKLKDSENRPLWTEMVQGDPNRIFGFPLVRSEVMPTTSVVSQAGTPFMLFGDFTFHAMGTRMDLTVDFSREADFKKGNIVMRLMQRVGYQLLLGEAIARVKTAAE